ncbi:MAG: component of SufBCD complex [Alkalilacustris sp.]
MALIDTRSFSNVWFWIALATMWSWLSHYVLGVPYDMVTRARRQGGSAQRDLEAVVTAQVNRRLAIARGSGQWGVAVMACGLTVMALLGFVYGLQLGQAVFLLALPATLAGAMSLAAARRLARDPLAGEALCAYLARHRLWVQLLGVVSIFVTTLWAVVQLVLAPYLVFL